MSVIKPGSVIDDRYLIEQQAGAGGMAVVWRARHLRLDRTVALKVMSPALAQEPEFRARFLEEARAVFELAHPNVITVHDFGSHKQVLYIVMRWVQGDNLRGLLGQRGLMEGERAVEVIEAVASALDAAHARGLLHRDVKPANILVEEASSRIFLADFGLVRSSESSDRTRSRLMGTDFYMAPERRRGEESPLGDVYSLGCVLWEMLAGSACPLPRAGDDGVASQVPESLRRVVLRATELEPSRRFPSAGELAGAARGALQGAGGERRTRPDRKRAFFEPLSTELRARVAQICSLTVTDRACSAELAQIRRELLDDALVLVVAGRVSAGKSTLVNALVGRRVAQTSAGESTRVVTVYRFTEGAERCELVHQDGSRSVLELTATGRIPDTIAPSDGAVAMIELSLRAEALRTLTIIDTPGLDSPTPARGELTEMLAIDSERSAIGRADALLFVMAGNALSADREALEAFRRRLGSAERASAANCIGVLSKADLVDASVASLVPASERAQRLQEALGALVSCVLPVAGRAAECAESGLLEQQDIDALRTLAGLEGELVERLLESTPAFIEDTMPLPAAQRARLLTLLGRFGIRKAIELARSGAPFSALALERWLRELSGIERLREQVDRLALRSDLLKAEAAARRLESLSWRFGAAQLRDEVEKLRIAEPLLGLVAAFEQCASGRVALEAGRLAEMETLLTGRTVAERLGLPAGASPQECRAQAARRARDWHAWALGGGASFAAAQVAGAVEDVYTKVALA